MRGTSSEGGTAMRSLCATLAQLEGPDQGPKARTRGNSLTTLSLVSLRSVQSLRPSSFFTSAKRAAIIKITRSITNLMAMRSAIARIPKPSRFSTIEASSLAISRRCFSDGKGKILSEEERAVENVYIQKKERERAEKARLKEEKEKAKLEKEKAEKKTDEPKKD